MFFKTDGIVLGIVPYDDKKSFVKILTNEFGLVSYAISNTHSKRSKLHKSLFTPFNILEMDVTHKPDRTIQKINEARIKDFMINLYSDPVKNSIILFLSEFLSKSIHQGENNKTLFEFIYDSIHLLNLLEKGVGNFHLIFLIKLTEFLGFRINKESYSEGFIFDLLEGRFSGAIPHHTYYLNPEGSYEIYYILSLSFSDLERLTLTRDKKNSLLDTMLDYYNLHVPGMNKIKSLDILKTLFS